MAEIDKIKKLYMEAVGREPTNEELEAVKDMDINSLSNFLFTSEQAIAERIDQINNVYTDNFGRPITNAELGDLLNRKESITNILKFAEEHPQNFKKTGQVVPPQDFQADSGFGDNATFINVKPSTGDQTMDGINTTQPINNQTFASLNTLQPPTATNVQLVKFGDSPHVYDVSSGKMRYVSAKEFSDNNYSWDAIEELDSSVHILDVTQGVPTVEINGNQVTVTDDNLRRLPSTLIETAVFSDPDLEDVDESLVNPKDVLKEMSGAEKLFETWRARPDLQEIFGSDLKGKERTPWAGIHLRDWAMQFGWLPSEVSKTGIPLEEYRPENVARAGWAAIFGELPEDDDVTFQSYVNALREGKILTWDELTGIVKANAGEEYQNMSEAEKAALASMYYFPGETDIPEELLTTDEEAIKKQVQEEFKPFYDDLIDDFKEEESILTGRAETDFTDFTGDLTAEETAFLDLEGMQYEKALEDANRSYVLAGQAFSGIRRKGIQDMDKERQVNLDEAVRKFDQRERELKKDKTRTVEDIEREIERSIEKTQQAFKEAVGEATVSRVTQEQIRDFMELQKRQEEEPSENIFGTSIGFSDVAGPDAEQKALAEQKAAQDTIKTTGGQQAGVDTAEFSKQVSEIYRKNFGRPITNAELQDLINKNTSLGDIQVFAENHPQNISKTGQVSEAQEFQKQSGFFNEETTQVEQTTTPSPTGTTTNKFKEGDLIRPAGFAETFAVDPSGNFTHIQDEDTLKSKFGEDAFSKVMEIPEEEARNLGLAFKTKI